MDYPRVDQLEWIAGVSLLKTEAILPSINKKSNGGNEDHAFACTIPHKVAHSPSIPLRPIPKMGAKTPALFHVEQ